MLALDAARKDAGLIVGTYRYIVATLSLPVRWVAYVAGFGGGRERGLQLIEEAAAYGGENQTDARFALILLYNREKRYDDALKQLAALRETYPRNRLVWLETGSTLLRAGRPADAERFLNDGFARFAGRPAAADVRRGRAVALQARRRARGAGPAAEADADLQQALAHEGRNWVHGRAHLELGKLALKAGNRAAARERVPDAADSAVRER